MAKAKIELDAKDVDVQGNFNTTTHRFTALEDGYYEMAAQIWLAGQLPNQRWWVFFQINGTYNNTNVMAGAGHTIDTDPQLSSPRAFWPVKWLNEGDYVELWVEQESGEDQTVQGTEPEPGHKTWISIRKL